MGKKQNQQDCPCGSGKAFAQCCGRYIDTANLAPTAEALMRSRYSAYALGKIDYLLDTWYPDTRPTTLDLENDCKWVRLKIEQASENQVTFTATCRINGKAQKLHENSRFRQLNGKWYYLDGKID